MRVMLPIIADDSLSCVCVCVVVMPKQFESLDPKAAGLVACRLFLENLDSILSGEAQKAAQPQDESEVSHTGKIAKKEGKISWEKSAEQLHNQVSRTLRRLLLMTVAFTRENGYDLF